MISFVVVASSAIALVASSSNYTNFECNGVYPKQAGFARDIQAVGVCLNTSIGFGFNLQTQYFCDNDELYYAAWTPSDGDQQCLSPATPSKVDNYPLGSDVICDGDFGCPYAIVREFGSSSLWQPCEEQALWADKAYIVESCQSMEGVKRIFNNASNDTFGYLECDDDTGLTLKVFDDEFCVGEPLLVEPYLEAGQCEGKGPEGDDGEYAAGYKQFVSCNDRSNMTTREPLPTETPEPTSAPKENDGDDDETWLIVGSIFIALFGVLAIGIIVWCFMNQDSSPSGYQGADVETTSFNR